MKTEDCDECKHWGTGSTKPIPLSCPKCGRYIVCPTCKDWGPTIPDLHSHTIICPNCKRYTYANLGVNCPAGSAWAFSANHAISILKARQMGFSVNVAGQILDGQARLNALAISSVPDNFPYPEKWRYYSLLEIHDARERRRSGASCEDSEATEVGPEFSNGIRIVAATVAENVPQPDRGRLRGTSSNGIIEGMD